MLSSWQSARGSRGEWEESHGLEGATSASSLASEQLESLSAASLPEVVGSEWQLAVDSLTSSMDSSVGPSLPSLSAAPPPPPSSDQLADPEGEQVTGQYKSPSSSSCEYNTSHCMLVLHSAGSISTEV